MRVIRMFNCRLIALLGLMFSLCIVPLAAQEEVVSKQISGEVNRLKKAQILRVDSSGNERLRDYQNRVKNMLAAVEQSLESGYVYLGLSQLQEAALFVHSRDFMDREDLKSGGIGTFEREWRTVGSRMAEDLQKFDKASTADLPAAVRALAKVARGKSETYYHSSMRFASLDQVEWGLYYLGTATTYIDFALFCQELRFQRSLPLPEVRSLDSRIAQLEERILAAYQRPGATEKQQYFNDANSALDLANELLKSGDMFGASLEYLTAYQFVVMVAPQEAATMGLPTLQERCKEYEARLAESSVDHSIGQLLWQKAKVVLDLAAKGEAARDDLVMAAATIGEVLPAYFELIEGD